MRDVPGLSLRQSLAGIPAMRRDQVGFLRRVTAEHGDIFRMLLGGYPVVMVNHPDHVQHVLVGNHKNYDKENYLFRSVRTIIRDGILTNRGGEEWHRRRRLLNPAFRRSSVAAFTHNMTDLTGEMLRRWKEYEPERVVDVTSETVDLALQIVLRSLFDVGTDDGIRRFEAAFVEVNAIAGNFFRVPFPPLTWRTPSRNRLRAKVREMDDFIAGLVRSRSAEEAHGGQDERPADLFTLMLDSLDEETGTRLTDEQLASEVLSMIVAGFETSSNSMAWVFQQLAERPEVQRRVQEEVDTVLDGRVPTLDDLAELTYTRMVVDETLRMFTPGWQTMRQAMADDEIGGYHIPAGTDVYINFFTLHRHPGFWENPEEFVPERFTPEAVAARHRHAYQPFGSGPRICIGKHFALAELVLVTAMLAQTFHVEAVPERLPVEFDPLLTLHPKGGIHLRIRRR